MIQKERCKDTKKSATVQAQPTEKALNKRKKATKEKRTSEISRIFARVFSF